MGQEPIGNRLFILKSRFKKLFTKDRFRISDFTPKGKQPFQKATTLPARFFKNLAGGVVAFSKEILRNLPKRNL